MLLSSNLNTPPHLILLPPLLPPINDFIKAENADEALHVWTLVLCEPHRRCPRNKLEQNYAGLSLILDVIASTKRGTFKRLTTFNCGNVPCAYECSQECERSEAPLKRHPDASQDYQHEGYPGAPRYSSGLCMDRGILARRFHEVDSYSHVPLDFETIASCAGDPGCNIEWIQITHHLAWIFGNPFSSHGRFASADYSPPSEPSHCHNRSFGICVQFTPSLNHVNNPRRPVKVLCVYLPLRWYSVVTYIHPTRALHSRPVHILYIFILSKRYYEGLELTSSFLPETTAG